MRATSRPSARPCRMPPAIWRRCSRRAPCSCRTMPGPIRLRPRLRARWLAVAAIALVGLLYYKPLKTYLGRRAELAQRKAEVRLLLAQKTALQHRVDLAGGGEELLRQAR